MKVKELLADARFACANNTVSLDREIESGYVGDLLSWVMANADKDRKSVV